MKSNFCINFNLFLRKFYKREICILGRFEGCILIRFFCEEQNIIIIQ